MRHADIVSTGAFLPAREVSNAALAEALPTEARGTVASLERATGIRTRFYAPDDWVTSDLAAAAART